MLRTALIATLSAAVLAGPAFAESPPPPLTVTVDAGSDKWTNAPSRTVQRTVSPAGVDGLVLKTYVDGALVDTSGQLALPMTFADGDHTIAVEASAPGHTTSHKALARVRVDTVAPEVALDVPPLVQWWDMPFVGHAYATDEHSGVKDWALTADGAPANWGSYFTMTLAPGPHTVEGRAWDVAGNVATAATPVMVTTPPPPAPKPAPAPPKPKSTPKSSRSKTAGPRRPAEPEYALCRNLKKGEQCQPGNGRKTKGGPGTGMVSHKGWPAVTGVLWKVLDSGDHQRSGGPDNDELLGHHGDDVLRGLGGKDILWGDWDPENNNGHQKDRLHGGPGNDWIYPSHGTNRMYGGSGGDKIIAYYGHGTIDCGPGRDFAQVRMNRAYKLKNCEVVRNFTQGGR